MTVQVYFPKNVFYISPKVSYPINSFHKETVSNPEWSCWSPGPGSLFLSSWSRLFNTVIKLGGKNHNAKQINPALHTIMYGMWYRRKMIWALFILKYTWQPLHFNKLLFLRTRKSSSPHSNEGIWGGRAGRKKQTRPSLQQKPAGRDTKLCSDSFSPWS